MPGRNNGAETGVPIGSRLLFRGSAGILGRELTVAHHHAADELCLLHLGLGLVGEPFTLLSGGRIPGKNVGQEPIGSGPGVHNDENRRGDVGRELRHDLSKSFDAADAPMVMMS
jgi:hypothetical protein